MEESDRWLFNYRTIPLNETDSDTSDDDSKKQTASEESQLWSELDISSRCDAALYKPNPFSIAKINAASRSRAIQTQSNIIVGKSLPPLGKAGTIEQPFNEIQQKKPKDHVTKTASHGGGSASRNRPSPPILASQTRLPLPARDSATRPKFASSKHTSHAHTSTKCSSLTTDPDKTLGQLKKTPSTLISPQQRRFRHLPTRASVTPSLVGSRVDWELQTPSISRQAETKLNPTTARGHSVLFISKCSGNTAPCNVRTPERSDALAMNSAIQKSALSRHVMTSQNNPRRPSVNRPPLRNLSTYTPTLTSQTPKCYDFIPNSDESWSTLPPPKKKLKPSTQHIPKNRNSGLFRIPNLQANSTVHKSGMSATSSSRVITFLPTPLVFPCEKEELEQAEDDNQQFSSPNTSPCSEHSFPFGDNADVLVNRSSSPPTSDPVQTDSDIHAQWDYRNIRERYLRAVENVGEV